MTSILLHVTFSYGTTASLVTKSTDSRNASRPMDSNSKGFAQRKKKAGRRRLIGSLHSLNVTRQQFRVYWTGGCSLGWGKYHPLSLVLLKTANLAFFSMWHELRVVLHNRENALVTKAVREFSREEAAYAERVAQNWVALSENVGGMPFEWRVKNITWVVKLHPVPFVMNFSRLNARMHIWSCLLTCSRITFVFAHSFFLFVGTWYVTLSWRHDCIFLICHLHCTFSLLMT